MSEITKVVGQFIVNHVSLSVLIFLAILSGFFKLSKIEIDPLGKFIGWIGSKLTKDVRNDVANLKIETANEFQQVKKDRADKVKEMMEDYNSKVSALRDDLDAFEERTNTNITKIQNGTNQNCTMLKKELAEIKKSNDMQTIRQIRAHVLDFANSCMNGRPHTKKEFDNIIRENEQYEALVKKHKVKNAVYKEDYAFIKKIYDKCRENNSFLKDPEAVNEDVDLCESES